MKQIIKAISQDFFIDIDKKMDINVEKTRINIIILLNTCEMKEKME